jgi:hypothetical protein
MSRLFTYYGRFQGARVGVLGLPTWARAVLTIVALPGIVAVALSIVAFVVSLLALLAVTVPVYGLLRAMIGGRSDGSDAQETYFRDAGILPGAARHVEATVRDAAPHEADETKLSD